MIDRDDDDAPVRRLLAASAAALYLVGLLIGFQVAGIMGGHLPGSRELALGAHMNGLLGAFWLAAVGWTMPYLRYGPVGRRRLAWATIVPAWANTLVTAVKAALAVHGVVPGEGATNDAVFAALTVTVVVPSLLAGVAWVAGFSRAPASARSSSPGAGPPGG